MKNKSASIALACAIGAGLGSMLAIEFGVFWFLGLLIGGIAGYFIYDLPTVIKAIPRAWKFAMEKRKGLILFLGVAWKAIVILFLSVFSMGCSYLCYLMLVKWGIILNNSFWAFPLSFLMSISALLILITLLVRYPKYDIVPRIVDKKYVDYTYSTEDHKYTGTIVVDWARKNILVFYVIIFFAPFVVTLLTAYTAIRVVISLSFWLPKAVKEIVIFFGKFFWKLFKLIHSDLRLLVGVNSCLGGFVGFYFHSILVGMIAGAVWGFISYYVISLKLLKLKPSH